MNTTPVISVLMGVYNCSEYLEQAVRCIQSQSFSNWELIMCDDCSEDDTYERALVLAHKDQRIKVLRNEKNLSLAPTLNKCLREAKGKYIARMDGDDTCHPARFEEELCFLEKHDEFALVSSHMELFDSEGIYRTIIYKEYPAAKDFLSGSQFCHAGCMVRKSVLEGLGGYNTKKQCERVEDFDLWVRLYAAGYRGYNIQKPLYSMRDDRNATKRRTLRNRLNEASVIYRTAKLFSLGVKGRMAATVPLIKFCVPTFLYCFFHKKH